MLFFMEFETTKDGTTKKGKIVFGDLAGTVPSDENSFEDELFVN